MTYETDLLLHDYSKELGLYEPLTLEELIVSHRSLRSNNITFTQHLNETLKEAREEAYNRLYKDKTKLGFIAIDDLRVMTIAQLCELIGE